MKNELHLRTKQGLYWTTSLKIVYEIFRFGISIIVARILSPNDFGIMAIGAMVIYYTNSLSDFGFNNALVQKKVIDKVHINSVFTLNLGISVFLTLLILTLSPGIARYFNSEESGKVLMFLSSVFILKTLHDIPESIMRRAVNFKFLSILNFIQSLTQSLIVLTLALSGFKYWSLVWAHIFSLFLATAVLLYKAKWKPCIKYDHKEMKAIYDFGMWTFIRGQLYSVIIGTPRIIIAKCMNSMFLGYFVKAFDLSSMPRESISASISSVMFSSFSRMQGNREELRKWFLKMLQVQSIILLPLLLGISALAPYCILILLGEKWRMSIVPLQILSITNSITMINSLSASLNMAVGDYKRSTLRAAYGCVLLILFCLFSVRWGVTGVCYAYLFASIVFLILGLDLVLKNTSLSIITVVSTIAPYIMINLLMVFVVKMFSYNLFQEIHLINMISLILIGGIFYILCIIAFNKLRKQNMFFPFMTGSPF